MSRSGEPWILIEAKKSDTALSPGLMHMAKQVGARWNFQLVVDLPQVNADPFERDSAPPRRAGAKLLRAMEGLGQLP